MSTFPFPRSSVAIEDIIVNQPAAEFSKLHYKRRRSTDAVIFKAQYLELDRRLQETFGYVAPSDSNRLTYSVTFATIIKNAANLFELGSRWIYGQAFQAKQEDLKIFHYLSLNKFTKASSIRLGSFQFYDIFSSPQVYRPFCSLDTWNESSALNSSNVPIWWTASNKLKHSNSGLPDYGTLENAVAAVGASFAFLHCVFGPGLVYGMDVDEDGRLYDDATSAIFSLTK